MMHLQSGSNVPLVPVCFWLQAGGGRGGRGRGWSGWRALPDGAGPPWPTSQAAPSAGVCRCFIEPVAIEITGWATISPACLNRHCRACSSGCCIQSAHRVSTQAVPITQAPYSAPGHGAQWPLAYRHGDRGSHRNRHLAKQQFVTMADGFEGAPCGGICSGGSTADSAAPTTP